MSKQLIFDVLGTKCSSCEILIEREIKAIRGVRNATASHGNGTLSVFADDKAEVDETSINQVLKPHGYSVRTQTEKAPLQLDLKRLGGMAVVIFALYVLAKNTGLLTYSPQIEGPTGLLPVFAIGLIAAFSSCTAVVGGLIAAVASSQAAKNAHLSLREKIQPHVLFNAGRLVGFAGFGALIGWVGQSISLSPAANGLFVLLIALVMIMLGVNLIGIFSRPVFAIRPPRFLSHRVHDLTHSSNPLIPLLAGAGTFFLPCGFTQSMQLYALSLGDPMAAAVTMAVFALGTMPALLGIGALTTVAKGATLQRITRAAGAIVIVLGISNMQNGVALLDIRLPSVTSTSAETTAIVEGGEQVISMRVTSAGVYEPAVLTVTEGLPVRWDVKGDTYMGCGNTLVMRAFGVSAILKPGPNTVRFTPTKAGTYTFSCSMGMIRGTMIVKPATT